MHACLPPSSYYAHSYNKQKNKRKTSTTIVVEVQERKMAKKNLAKLAHKRTTQSLKTKT
jgi:hypothetical protein